MESNVRTMLNIAEKKRVEDLEKEVDEIKDFLIKHFVTPLDENKGVMKRRKDKGE